MFGLVFLWFDVFPVCLQLVISPEYLSCIVRCARMDGLPSTPSSALHGRARIGTGFPNLERCDKMVGARLLFWERRRSFNAQVCERRRGSSRSSNHA